MTDSEEAEERELEEAPAAYQEELGNPEEAAADMQADMARTEKEETAKRYQDILIALGFTRYDNLEKGIACKLKAGHLLLGRTFTDQHPIGNMWVSCLVDCEHGKKGEFLKREQCKQIPQVALFYLIRDGKLPMPEPTVTGEVIGQSEKAVQIQFDEFGLGQYETQWWGFGALKKSEEGVDYIPGSYSKETEHYNPKMQVPRPIILKDYEGELAAAPVTTQTDTTKEKNELPKKPDELAKTDLQKPTEKHTMDKVITPEPEQRGEVIVNIMKTYLEKSREMVEQIFPELEQPQLSELSQDIATSMFIENRKEARKERW